MDEFLLQRRYEESPASPKDHRHASERDRDRILHSSAFRRLQGKTQVFGIGQADFYRTRLTHSVEVAQIARAIAHNLLIEEPRLNRCLVPELAEAAALAHDLGHPPFGHAGEQTLDDCMCEVSHQNRIRGKKVLRFEGNAQTFHILVAAEPKSPAYPGLNLTRATLAGVLKYPYEQDIANDKFIFSSDLPVARWALQGGGSILKAGTKSSDRQPETSITCQILDWADDCAYSIHDIEDALQAQFLHPGDLENPRFARRVFAHFEKTQKGRGHPQFDLCGCPGTAPGTGEENTSSRPRRRASAPEISHEEYP
jgi:dGTPase